MRYLTMPRLMVMMVNSELASFQNKKKSFAGLRLDVIMLDATIKTPKLHTGKG